MSARNSFYVYEHWRSDTGECFYVGKGCRGRAYVTKGRSLHHQNIMKRLVRLGLKLRVRILKRDLTEDQAFDLEIERIAFWRKKNVRLVNLSNGGEGQLGYHHTDRTKRILSQMFTGRTHTDEARERIRLSKLGKPRPDLVGKAVSEATRKKLSAALKGKKVSIERIERFRETLVARGLKGTFQGRSHSVETRERMRLAQLGKPKSEEHKAAMKAAHTRPMLGKKRSAETKRRCSLALTGRIFSEEHCSNLSAAKCGKSPRTNHIRWHTNRGIANPDCEFCLIEIAAVDSHNQKAAMDRLRDGEGR